MSEQVIVLSNQDDNIRKLIRYGCVIGAGAVVTHSVDPYSIVVGNPGRVIKKRFSEDIISKMLEMKWWDWDYEDIYRARDLIQSENIDELYRYYKDVVKA